MNNLTQLPMPNGKPICKSGDKWMSFLDKSLKISDINLPGTHDSVSSAGKMDLAKHFYTTQNLGIEDQLKIGVRLLDIRVKVGNSDYTKNSNGKLINFDFVTCHGDNRLQGNMNSNTDSFLEDKLSFFAPIGKKILSAFVTVNEFDSLNSVLSKCRDFLVRNHTEFIVIMVKIDDWNGYDKSSNTTTDLVLDSLTKELNAALQHNSKSLIYNDKAKSTIPTVKDVEGKIFLLNRINDAFIGNYINWEDGEEGSQYPKTKINPPKTLKFGNLNYYVQDKYGDFSGDKQEQKKQKFMAAMKHNQMTINFASATDFPGVMRDVNKKILQECGKYDAAQRPSAIGQFRWSLHDYAGEQYKTNKNEDIEITSFIISSNFGYQGYELKFDIK